MVNLFTLKRRQIADSTRVAHAGGACWMALATAWSYQIGSNAHVLGSQSHISPNHIIALAWNLASNLSIEESAGGRLGQNLARMQLSAFTGKPSENWGETQKSIFAY